MGLFSFNFFLVGPVKLFFLQEWRFGRSRLSKVIDFCNSQKCVCDFLLVHHSNLGPILHRFRDIADFMLTTPPLFHPNFWGVLVRPDRPRWGQSEQKPKANQPWHHLRSILTCVKNIWRWRTEDLVWHNRTLC